MSIQSATVCFVEVTDKLADCLTFCILIVSFREVIKKIGGVSTLRTLTFRMYGKGANKNKLASLEATLVRNSAHPLTHSLTAVKCRSTSVAKKTFISFCKSYFDMAD